MALLEDQAKQRDATATARHHARLAWKEQDDLAAFARGEQPEPLSEESFRVVHGAEDAPAAYTRYQASQREGEALGQIRGKTPKAIADAESAWQGDPAVFASARSKDAAERTRDPVAYVLATQPGLEQALKEASPEERLWLLWQAEAAAGIPVAERSLTSRAQQEAQAKAWDAIPPGKERSGRVDFLIEHVQSLPPALRGPAIRTLARFGITDGTEAELTSVVAEIDDGRFSPARTLAEKLTPLSTPPGGTSDVESYPKLDPPQFDAVAAIGDSRIEEQSSSSSPAGPVTLDASDSPPVSNASEEVDLSAAPRARVVAVDAVAMIDDPDDLEPTLALISTAFADDPEAAAELESRAREYAANPPLPASRDTEGRVRNFSDWAGDYGYYRDNHIIAATDAVRSVNYEVEIGEDGSLGVIAAGDDEPFTTFSAEELANLNLSNPDDRALFELMLDAISGSVPLEDLLAEAEKRDPTRIIKSFHPKGGPYETVRPSETVELIRLASEALNNGADPAAVTAALKAGLFPTSDWLVLGELLISLTPFGLALDAVDAVRAFEELQGSNDEAGRKRAWINLAAAIGGIAPIGDALKLGARNIGTAKVWLRRLAERESLTTEQLIAEAEHFAQVGLRTKKASFQIGRLVGDAWKNLDQDVRKAVKGRAAQLYGGIAEKLVRPAAEVRLKLDGYRVLSGETHLNYQGVNFWIDVVGLKEGAIPVGRKGKMTIEVAGILYRLEDVRLIDAKFASAGFSDAQRAALKKLDGRGAVQRYVPLLEDMPIEDLAEILNEIKEFKVASIRITPEMIMRHAETFEKGTTMADFFGPLIAAGLVSAWSIRESEQPQRHHPRSDGIQ